MGKAKSIFASKTFWAAVISVVAGAAPILSNAVDKGQLNAKDISEITLVICAAASVVVGRVAAVERIYTPDILPGPNKQDAE